MGVLHQRNSILFLWPVTGFVVASICFSLTGLYYQSLLISKRTFSHYGVYHQVQQATNITTKKVGLASSPTVENSTTPAPTSPIHALQERYAPIFSRASDIQKPVRIRILLFENADRKIEFRSHHDPAMRMISDEVMNICLDGWNRSAYFNVVGITIVPDFAQSHEEFILREDQDIVWVVDMRRIVFRSTHSIFDQVHVLARSTRNYQQEQGRVPGLKVIFMDFRDRFRSRAVCTSSTKQLVQLLGVGNVRNVVQQVVDNRDWNPQKAFVDPGNVWIESKKNQSTGCLGGLRTLHMPYTVRSDYVEAIDAVYRQYLPLSTKSSSYNNLPPHTNRSIDVAHFWSLHSRPNEAKAQLRNAVTSLILSLNNVSFPGHRGFASEERKVSDSTSRAKAVRVIGHQVSGGGKVGRTLVSTEYLQALLSTKIVVVAQRDGWEDHYRLFEALISGALVMTDPMWTLPDGYQHEQNILVYNSLDHLREMIIFYLDHDKERVAIAERGWKLALTRHRTYHWMEKLFFGTLRSS